VEREKVLSRVFTMIFGKMITSLMRNLKLNTILIEREKKEAVI